MPFSIFPWTKYKRLILLLILSSFFGFLEWGQGQTLFIWKAEYDIISKLFSDPLSVIHPLTILPLIGQILLIVALFQIKPNRFLVWTAIGGLSMLFVLMCFIGVLDTNYKIFLSTIPFIVLAVLTIIESRKQSKLDL